MAKMETLDALRSSLNQVCALVTKDLEALPEDTYTKSLGGKARTVSDIIFEIVTVNKYFGTLMRGGTPEPLDPSQGWLKAPDSFGGKAEVMAAFSESAREFQELLAGLTAEDLGKQVPGDADGKTYFDRINLVTMHMMYHSGQFNFMQTLLGDDAWHW